MVSPTDLFTYKGKSRTMGIHTQSQSKAVPVEADLGGEKRPMMNISSSSRRFRYPRQLLEETQQLKSRKILEKETSESTVVLPDKDFEHFKQSTRNLGYYEILTNMDTSISHFLLPCTNSV